MSNTHKIDGSKLRPHELNTYVPFTDKKGWLGSIARGLKNASDVMSGMYSSPGGCCAPPENSENGDPSRDNRPI